MSYESDQRVVELQFNNKQFEADVRTTISTLDKLQNKLQFDGASKGFAELEKSANKVNFDGLLESVNSIADRFTLKGTIIRKFFDDIADRALSLEHQLEGIFKSMTWMEQAGVGWDKYADKTSAVQTIMGAVANEVEDVGDRMKYVNKQLETLNWFTDETSYNFLDMVNNIGKFTANQVPLDLAVESMQGIATWAAKSGANVTEASRAMYNLSQAISSGALKLLDWKSIELANMATAEFKQTAIDTAEEMGVLQRVGEDLWETIDGTEVSVKSFRDSLKAGWISSDVLLATLSKYGAFTTELNKTYKQTGLLTSDLLSAIEDYKNGVLDISDYMYDSKVSAEELEEAIAHLAEEQYDFGRSAFAAAQEAKTFQEAIDSVKDAVSTGWMNTFEIIFGDYQEAKRLWTDLSNFLYDVFNRNAENRNEMLGIWKELGGREDLFEGLYNIADNLMNIFTALRHAWQEVFPPTTWVDLIQLTRKFREFSEHIYLSKEQLEKLRGVVVKILQPFRMVANVVTTVFKVVVTLVVMLGKLVKSFVTMLTSAKALATGIDNLANRSTAFSIALQVLVALFRVVATVVTKAIDIFKNFGNALKNSTSTDSFINALKTIALTLTGGVIFAVEAFGTAISKCISFMSEHVLTTKTFTIALEAIKTTFQFLGGTIVAVWEACGNLFDRLKNVHSIKDFFKAIWDSLKEVWTKIVNSDALEKVGNVLKSIFNEDTKAKIDNITKSLMELWGSLSIGQIVVLIFAGAIVYTIIQLGNLLKKIGQVAGALTQFGDVLKAIQGWFKAMQRATQYSALIQIGSGLLLIAGALVILSRIPRENLWDAAEALFSVTLAASLLVAAFGYLGSTVKNFTNVGLAMIAMGAGLLMFAKALQVLSQTVSSNSDAVEFVVVLSGFLASLWILGKLNPEIKTTAASMVAFAAGVYIMATAFRTLANAADGLDLKTLGNLAAIIGVYAGALALMGKFSATAGVGALMAVTSMLAFIGVLKLLTLIKIDDYVSFGVSFAAMIVGWTAIVAVGARFSKALLKMSLGLALTIGALFGAVKVLEELTAFVANVKDWHDVADGLLTLAGVVIAIFGTLNLIGGLKINANNTQWKGILAVAVDIVALAGALWLLSGIAWQDLIAPTVALGLVMLALAVVVHNAQHLGDGKAIKNMVWNIVALAGTLMALSLFTKNGISQIIDPAIAMAVALVGLGAAFYGAGKIAAGVDWKPILFMTANVVAVGASLIGLTYFGQSATQIIAAGGAMFLALGGLALVAVAAQALQKLNAVQAIGGMLALAGVAVALGYALKLVIEAAPDSGAIILAGSALMLAAIGLGVAAALANRFVKSWEGFASLLSAALVALAVSEALSKMAPYADSMMTAVKAFGIAIGILVAALAVLTVIEAIPYADVAMPIAALILLGLSLALNVIADAFVKFAEHVDQFAHGVDAIADAIVKLSAITDEQVDQAKDNLINFGKTLVVTIIRISGDVEEQSVKMGEFVVEGFRKGIECEQAKRTITEVAYGMWARFKNAFESNKAADINSPSYAMYKDGEYIVYGLVDGVLSEQGTIKQTGIGVWEWFHDGAKTKLHNVAIDQSKLYCKEFELEMVDNEDEIVQAAERTAAAAGDMEVLAAAEDAGKSVGDTIIDGITGAVDAGKAKVASVVQDGVNWVMKNTSFGNVYGSIFGSEPIFLSEEDKKKYERIMSADFENMGYGSREEAVEKMLGYDPTSKSSLIQHYLGPDDVFGDLERTVSNITGSMEDYGYVLGGVSSASGAAGTATASATENLEELLDVTNYAIEAVGYFYDKEDVVLKLFDDSTPWMNAIKSTEDLVLEHYKFENQLDEDIQALQSFGDMNVEQAKAAKEAWVEYFDTVQNGISQGFGSVFSAPTFAQGEFDVETTSFKTMMNNLEAQEKQMTYFTNTLIKLKQEGLNEVYLQSLLDAGPENLEEIISWDKLTAEEVKRINMQYEKLQNATTKLTMDYITTTADTFGALPDAVEKSIVTGIENMSTYQVQQQVYDKTSQILEKVLDADTDWEEFNGTRLGQLLDDGIASGVESMTDVAVSAVEQLAKEMIAELQQEVNAARAQQMETMANDWNAMVTKRVQVPTGGGGGGDGEDGGYTWQFAWDPSQESLDAIHTMRDALGYMNYMSGSTNYDRDYEARYANWAAEGRDVFGTLVSAQNSATDDLVSSNLRVAQMEGFISSAIATKVSERLGNDNEYTSEVSGTKGNYSVSITQNNYSSDHLNAETIANDMKSIAAEWQSAPTR